MLDRVGILKIANSNKKLILNFENGIFYNGAEDAAAAYNLKVNTLRKKLKGRVLKNNTMLKYV